jgi:hypothetical protein
MTNERAAMVERTQAFAAVDKWVSLIDDGDRRAVARMACEAVANDIIDALLASAPSAPQPTKSIQEIVTKWLRCQMEPCVSTSSFAIWKATCWIPSMLTRWSSDEDALVLREL